MKNKIIKQKWPRRGYANAPTGSIRELGKEILGELDTAISFMYLFRRFGAPTYTTDDEYKILYVYELKYRDMLFSIHASYHEFVYFNALMPKKIRNAHIREYKTKTGKIAAESIKNNICYMPYSTPFSKSTPQKLVAKNNILYDRKAKEFFSEEDYKFLCNYQLKNGLFENRNFYDKIDPFNKMLCKEFRNSLAEEDRLMYERGEHIDDYPELKTQCEDFFNELLRGYYIRDVPINIKGYESEINNIIKFEEE